MTQNSGGGKGYGPFDSRPCPECGGELQYRAPGSSPNVVVWADEEDRLQDEGEFVCEELECGYEIAAKGGQPVRIRT